MTTDNTDVIYDCLIDLKEVLQSIALLDNKTLLVYSAEELMDKASLVPLPAAGAVYEGMRATGEANKATNRTGTSAEAVFTVLVLADKLKLSTEGTKQANIHVMGLIRKALRMRKSPTGHVYRFVLEAPADEKGDTLIWAQRWAVPVSVI